MQKKSTWEKLNNVLLHLAWMAVLGVGSWVFNRFERTQDQTTEALHAVVIQVQTMQAKLPTEYPPALFQKLFFDSIEQNRREHERMIDMIDKVAARRVNPVAVPKP